MSGPLRQEIEELEARLERAMRGSDLPVLDALLSEDLLFTNHEGKRVSKREDLDLHRSGLLKLDSLDFTETVIHCLADAAVVSVRVCLTGTYDHQPFKSDYRFTRVWARRQERWQLVAAHSSLVA